MVSILNVDGAIVLTLARTTSESDRVFVAFNFSDKTRTVILDEGPYRVFREAFGAAARAWPDGSP